MRRWIPYVMVVLLAIIVSVGYTNAADKASRAECRAITSSYDRQLAQLNVPIPEVVAPPGVKANLTPVSQNAFQFLINQLNTRSAKVRHDRRKALGDPPRCASH